MKKIILGLALTLSLSSFANTSEPTNYNCKLSSNDSGQLLAEVSGNYGRVAMRKFTIEDTAYSLQLITFWGHGLRVVLESDINRNLLIDSNFMSSVNAPDELSAKVESLNVQVVCNKI
jgi:hypothetical protein